MIQKQLSAEKPTLAAVRSRLRRAAKPSRAADLQRFFKTGAGEYAEGDRFLGLTVPELRAIARQYIALPHGDLLRLLRSPLHEERLVALLIFVDRYARGAGTERLRIVRSYLAHTRFINNWDLVDLSAPKILGRHLATVRDRTVLTRLAGSKILWERRIAIIATLNFIMQGQYRTTLTIAAKLVDDPHDLIHKAVGWMLREVGKRSRVEEEKFLQRYAAVMPRTMLRYAIEHFPEGKRRAYLGLRSRSLRKKPRASSSAVVRHRAVSAMLSS